MEEALIKRIPPHSIEAEQSVIGAMLLDRDAILIASEILTSDDFYQNQYGIIFDAMVELCNEGKPVDLITLQNRLKEKDLPPDISSMEYVRELIEAVPTSANVKYYANIVSEKALLRRLIKATEDVANTCYLEKESTEMILEESEKKLFNILQRSIGGDYVPIQQVVLNAINNIEKASKLKGSVTGIPTGFIDLDYKTSGMHPSDLVLIAARPSMGKTAFVLNIAQYMAFRKDVTVAIFSLEMSKEQRPQKRGIPANFRVGRDLFFIFKKMIFLLAVFGYQFICVRITQFFRFLKVAASFIRLLQLYLAKSQ